MKTTIDLPEELVRKLKLRALREGRKLKEMAAAVVRAGLAAEDFDATGKSVVVGKDKKTGLPLIHCRRRAVPAEELTPDRIADILTSQETGWAHDAG